MLSIRARLNTVIVAVTIILILLLGSQAITLDSASELYELRHRLDRLHVLMLEMRRAEKDFLLRSDLKYLAKHEELVNQGSAEINAVDHAMRAAGLGHFDPEAQTTLQAYGQSFRALVAGAQELGLNQEQGLHGELRELAHELEADIKDQPALLVGLLQMRRAEKDFLQRRDQKSLDRFSAEQERENELLSRQHPASAAKLQAYAGAFLRLVAQQRTLGLTEKDGLQGKLRADVHQLEHIITTQEERLERQISEQSANIRREAWLRSGLLGLGAAFALGLLAYSRQNILRRLRHAARTAKRLGRGELQEPVAVSGRDEISTLLGNMETMRTDILAAQEIVQRSNRVSHQLNELSRQIEGISELRQLAETALGQMTQLLDCQVGVFYAHHDDDSYQLLASHGLRRQINAQTLHAGHCRAGEAIRARQIEQLHGFPAEHLGIESGLGAGNPARLVLLPLLREDRICGYMELGSLNPAGDFDLPFLRRAGEIIAIALETAQTGARLQQLASNTERHARELEEKQRLMQQAHADIQRKTRQLEAQQEELQAQQEELRTMNEELETYARQMEQQLRMARA